MFSATFQRDPHFEYERKHGPTGSTIAPEQPQAMTNQWSPKEESPPAEGLDKFNAEQEAPEDAEKGIKTHYTEPKAQAEQPKQKDKRREFEEEHASMNFTIAPGQPQPMTDARTKGEESLNPEGLDKFKSEQEKSFHEEEQHGENPR